MSWKYRPSGGTESIIDAALINRITDLVVEMPSVRVQRMTEQVTNAGKIGIAIISAIS
jgi:hypothetical protein